MFSVRHLCPALFTRCSWKTLPIKTSFYGIRARTAFSEDELNATRQWLAKFDVEKIPKSIFELSFSRSSGPGGQNVNKLNSKATLRVSLSSLFPHIPQTLHEHIHESRYCSKSGDIVIQSEDSRKQTENVQKCFAKLKSLITDAARDKIPGVTSVAQKERVKNLQKADQIRRLKSKKHHSSKKATRRGGAGFND